MVWSECQRQGSSSDAESRKVSDQPVKKVDPERNDPSGNPELSTWLIYGGKALKTEGHPAKTSIFKRFFPKASTSCLWCGIL
jgi:hypothetical protein